jgi:hypothetical protein
MLYIFYVGTEVTIISNLPALLKQLGGIILEDAISPFIACTGKFNDWSLEWWSQCLTLQK